MPFSLHMRAKLSFAHRLQTATMASSRTSARNNSPRVQNNGSWVSNVSLQRRLATQTVTMLTSCRQVLSEVELRRIFHVCKGWANSSFVCICKEKYGSIHEATRAIRLLIVWKSSTHPKPRPGGLGRGFVQHFHTCSVQTVRFGLLYRNILFHDLILW